MKYCHRCWSPLANSEVRPGHVVQFCPQCDKNAWQQKCFGRKIA